MMSAGVYVPEGPERDALTAALAKECYVPVYLDPKIVRSLPPACTLPGCRSPCLLRCQTQHKCVSQMAKRCLHVI